MARDWAQDQTLCPVGHPALWPNSTCSYSACPDCPCVSDGRGHFALWCEACGRHHYPPGCLAVLQDHEPDVADDQTGE